MTEQRILENHIFVYLQVPLFPWPVPRERAKSAQGNAWFPSILKREGLTCLEMQPRLAHLTLSHARESPGHLVNHEASGLAGVRPLVTGLLSPAVRHPLPVPRAETLNWRLGDLPSASWPLSKSCIISIPWLMTKENNISLMGLLGGFKELSIHFHKQ